jgi:hypothetical protein
MVDIYCVCINNLKFVYLELKLYIYKLGSRKIQIHDTTGSMAKITEVWSYKERCEIASYWCQLYTCKIVI